MVKHKYNPYNGIVKWMGSQLMTHGWRDKQEKACDRIIREFNAEVLRTDLKKPSSIARLASQDFDVFKSWFKRKYC